MALTNGANNISESLIKSTPGNKLDNMAFPFAPMPTLRDVIEAAVEQGCRYGELKGDLIGPRGATRARYLINKQQVIYPLPNLPDDWRLPPTLLASMVRSLEITGYDHLISHIEE